MQAMPPTRFRSVALYVRIAVQDVLPTFVMKGSADASQPRASRAFRKFETHECCHVRLFAVELPKPAATIFPRMYFLSCNPTFGERIQPPLPDLHSGLSACNAFAGVYPSVQAACSQSFCCRLTLFSLLASSAIIKQHDSN